MKDVPVSISNSYYSKFNALLVRFRLFGAVSRKVHVHVLVVVIHLRLSNNDGLFDGSYACCFYRNSHCFVPALRLRLSQYYDLSAGVV